MKQSTLIILALSIFFSSCKEEELISTNAEQYYNLSIEGAVIPVLVRGNTASGKFLLFIQGGPGYPSIDFATVDFPKWKNSVEKDHAIVYYDQRGYGNKQGDFDPAKITIDQYLTDIHEVALFISQQYPDAQIFLFGHSFGGKLAHLYDLKYGNSGLNTATISISGPITHDGDVVEEERWDFRKQMMERVATKLIDDGKKTEFWQEALTWIQSVDKLDTREEFNKWNYYADYAEPDTDTSVGIKDYLKVAFGSLYNVFPYFNGSVNDMTTTALFNDEKESYDLDKLGQITKPVLIFAGFYDSQAPLEELQFIHSQLGSADKNLIIYENGGHYTFLDDPVRFQNDVKSFTDNF